MVGRTDGKHNKDKGHRARLDVGYQQRDRWETSMADKGIASHPYDLNRMLNQAHQYKSKHACPDRSDTGR
jgi:hypothetical protein